MRVAIVGATGMLGRHTLAAAAAAGHEVVAIARSDSSLSRLGSAAPESRLADLDDRESLRRALQDVDAVVNCAGYYPTVPRPWRAEVETATRQMENFYAACAERPLQKIVYLGGAIALRRHPAGEPGDETLDYPGEPPTTNPYVRVKCALDVQARAKAREGLPVVIGIPTMTFGEYDYGPTTGRLIVEIANRTLPGFVKGNRNVIYAGDAGRGLVRVCEQGRPGERYLLTGENISMSELVTKIAQISHAPVPRAIPVALARLASALQTARFRWLNGPVPRVDATAIAVMSAGQFLNGAKARSELGFSATETLEHAIGRALAWFRSNGNVKPNDVTSA
jgi:dihydroflavonol-4-reductase